MPEPKPKMKYVKPSVTKRIIQPGYEASVKKLLTDPDYFRRQVNLITKRAGEHGVSEEKGGKALALRCIKFLQSTGRMPKPSEVVKWAAQYNLPMKTVIAIIDPHYFEREVKRMTERAEALGVGEEELLRYKKLAGQYLGFLLDTGRRLKRSEVVKWAAHYGLPVETVIAIITGKKPAH